MKVRQPMSRPTAAVDGERVVAVAVRYNGLLVTLPTPARHPDILRPLYEMTKHIVAAEDQGFMTSGGRFVDRTEAARIAQAARQIVAAGAVFRGFVVRTRNNQ